MNKLFSRKLASRLSNSYANSLHCKDCASFANQNHLSASFLTRPLQDHSHSWSSHPSFAHKIHGFFSVPAAGKRFIFNPSNTLFKGSIKSLVQSRSLFTFSKLEFQLKPGFDHQWGGWRSWFQRLTPNAVVLGLVIANVTVFLLWRIADPMFMLNNFTISIENVRCGRIHTLITSAFSHTRGDHLVHSMIGLYFFGMKIARVFGPEFLLKLYLAGAIGGSTFFLAHNLFQALSSKIPPFWDKDNTIRIIGKGADGVIEAVMLVQIFLLPKSLDIFLFPKPPTCFLKYFTCVPAIILGVSVIAINLLYILEDRIELSGSAAVQMGGAAVAVLVSSARVRRGRF